MDMPTKRRDPLSDLQTTNEAPEVGTPDNPSDKILTLANLITVSRIVLTFVFLWLFTTHGNRYVAIAVYVVAACTDWLDGQVARATKTVSWFGKMLDPLVDRALLFTGVLGLYLIGELPLWIVILVIGRDVYLALGGLIVSHFHPRPVDVVFIGKVTTALLMSGFSLMLLGLPRIDGLGLVGVDWLPVLNSQGGAMGIIFVYLGCICSVITACIYTATGARYVRESLKERESGEN